MVKSGTEVLILGGVILFSLATFPTTYMTATVVLSVIAYLMSNSLVTVLGIFIGANFLRLFISPRADTTLVKPEKADVEVSRYTEQQREGFQAKDPITIHQRITAQKAAGPLKPKVDTVTGVLESPEILDALQITEVRPVEQGGAMKTRPASLKAPEIIPTPPELTPPSEKSVGDAPPVANPVLQNGQDNEGVFTALIAKGTSLFKGNPTSNVPAASTSGPSAP
jgi:hypothetical protein